MTKHRFRILNAQYLMAIYNIPQYGNIYKAHRIKCTKETIQYEIVLCTIGPDNTDFIMKHFMQ